MMKSKAPMLREIGQRNRQTFRVDRHNNDNAENFFVLHGFNYSIDQRQRNLIVNRASWLATGRSARNEKLAFDVNEVFSF